VTSSFLPVSEVAGGIVMLIVSSFILTLTIEEIGKRGKFTERFTGTVISPIFTAMPELVIIIIALVLVGKEPGSEVAAGTIIGEPFMVSAIGFPVVALTLLLVRRKRKIEAIDPILSKSLIYFGLVFPIMLIPLFFGFVAVRITVAAVLVLLYLVFLLFVKGKETFEEEATSIRIRNRALLSLIVASGVVLLIGGSTMLVQGIDSLSLQTGINRELITILLVPIGTIVPETMNAIIWALRSKTSLAIGAMAGEEMYFATFFPALGILASQWVVTFNGIVAILLTSSFSIALGLITYRFRNAVYVYVIYLASFLIFLLFIY
jgi:cation:H+ antiporter